MIELNYKDYTIKVKAQNVDELEFKLKTLGAIYVGLDIQTDHYFQTEKGKLKWRVGTIENLITHYERVMNDGMEKTIVYRYDLNPTSKEIADLKRLYVAKGIFTKERKIYLQNNVKVHLDRLKNGEQFIEIEAIDRENRFTNEELRSQCVTLQFRLNIQDSDLVLTGYFK